MRRRLTNLSLRWSNAPLAVILVLALLLLSGIGIILLNEAAYRVSSPAAVRELLGDGVFAGAYELPDEQVEAVWRTGVDEVRELLEHAWR